MAQTLYHSSLLKKSESNKRPKRSAPKKPRKNLKAKAKKPSKNIKKSKK